jgi:hypothetical protein
MPGFFITDTDTGVRISDGSWPGSFRNDNRIVGIAFPENRGVATIFS